MEHPLRAPAIAVVHAIGKGLRATTMPHVFHELAHVRARRHGRLEAVGVARRWLEALAPLPSADADDVAVARDLYLSCPALDSYDALLAAVAVRSGAEALVSADRGFADVPGLRFVDLASAELDRLLGV